MWTFVVLCCLLAVAPAPAQVESAVLLFESEALDLETGAVVILSDPLAAGSEADISFGYHADRTPHCVAVQAAGAELAILAATPFEYVSASDIAAVSFSPEVIDQSCSAGDTVLLRTSGGAVFKIGNLVEDAASNQVVFDYDLLQGPPQARAPEGQLDGIQLAADRPSREAATTEIPAGIEPGPWRAITRAIDRGAYGARWNEGSAPDERALQAVNPAQAYTTHFTRQGILLRPWGSDGELGMGLRRWGFGSDLEPVNPARPLAQGQRVEYVRGPITEWYVNRRSGLEQGFTLATPPPGASDEAHLRLELEIWGTLEAQAVDDAVEWRGEAGGRPLRYGGLAVWDAEDRVLPAEMRLTANRLILEVDSRDAVYPLTIDPTIVTEDAELLASDRAAEDRLGGGVSASGETIVAGAGGDDDNGSRSGSAYIFEKPAGGWSGTVTEVAKLLLSDGAASDHFGNNKYGLSITGDLVFGGVQGDDDNGPDSGSVYVFEKPLAGWSGTVTEIAKLLPSDGAATDVFGQAVAASGDSVVVGATLDDDNGSASGSAYIFEKPPGGWVGILSESAKLLPSDGAAQDNFGAIVAISGDLAVVAAFRDDDQGINSGSAYIFEKPVGGWSGVVNESAKLLPSTFGANALFGLGAGVSGDAAVVSTPFTGAYVFEKPGGGWSGTLNEVAELMQTTPVGQFGNSAAMFGDTVVIGSPFEASGPGSVYVFEKPVGGWVGTVNETARLRASDGMSFDVIGGAVSVSSGVVVTGATGHNHGLTDAGAAYVFTGFGAAPNQPPVCSAPASVSAECGGTVTTVTGLDGSASSDPDGDALTYAWTTDCPEASFEDAEVATPSLDLTSAVPGVCAPLSCTATLTVDDGTEESTCTPTTINVSDTQAPSIMVAGDPAPVLQCAVDGYSDPGATASDVCDPAVSVSSAGSVDPNNVGSYPLTYDASDACGNPATQAGRTVSVIDTLAPSVLVDTTPIVVTDTACTGSTTVSLPTASATDLCDPVPGLGNDAPASFPAGSTTTVTYTASDASLNAGSDTVDVTVLYGADIAITANKHTVGSGSHPGSNKEPLVGIEVCAYDKSDGSCSRDVCGGISHQQYGCIVETCQPVSCCTTDTNGQCTINTPHGDWIVISDDATKTTLPDPLGVSASDLVCGETKQKHLQQIVRNDGKKMPGKTTRRTGSELLIIEPEVMEWTDTTELYPVVFESVGDWGAEVAVNPPEGFVSDYESLVEQVTDEVEAVQFTLTDVGSDWIPTETRYTLEHSGRREVVLSRVGVRVSEGLARAKGISRHGHPLGADGRPVPQAGFDPRAERLVEIVGWTEPSADNSDWTVKLHVEVATELELLLSRGHRGKVVAVLADGEHAPGDYEIAFQTSSLGPGRFFLRLESGDLVQTVGLAER